MKKLYLAIYLIAFTIHANAQSIGYSQLNKIFNTWSKEKTSSAKPVTAILKSINRKWTLRPGQPVNESKIKKYTWFAVGIQTDTATIVLFADDGAAPVKYSLLYTFYDRTLYKFILQTVKTAKYYSERELTFQKDRKKGTYTLRAVPDEKTASNSRNNFLLTDHNINHIEGSERFTAEINSGVIPN